MKKMEQKEKQNRIAILRAATEAFRTEGYIGTSMDTIAAKAGITKQTVYRYFNAKHTLFAAVLVSLNDVPHGNFAAELDREDSREALLHFSRGFVRRHMSDEHMATMRLILAEGPIAPEIVRTHLEIGPKKIHAKLTVYLDEHFTISDTEYAARMLLNTLLSPSMDVLFGRYESPTKEEMDCHADRTIDLFMNFVS